MWLSRVLLSRHPSREGRLHWPLRSYKQTDIWVLFSSIQHSPIFFTRHFLTSPCRPRPAIFVCTARPSLSSSSFEKNTKNKTGWTRFNDTNIEDRGFKMSCGSGRCSIVSSTTASSVCIGVLRFSERADTSSDATEWLGPTSRESGTLAITPQGTDTETCDLQERST